MQAQFHPPCSNAMCNIIVNLPILEYRRRILETSSLGDDLCISPYFHICLMNYVIELALQDSKYYVVVLLNMNSLDSRVCHQTSSLSLTLPMFGQIMSFTNNIHYGISVWICYISSSITKDNKNGLRDDSWCNPITTWKCSQSPPLCPHPSVSSTVHVLKSP